MKKERAPITVGMKVKWVSGPQTLTGVVNSVDGDLIFLDDGQFNSCVHRRQIISRFKPKEKLKEAWVRINSRGEAIHCSNGPIEGWVLFREVRRKK